MDTESIAAENVAPVGAEPFETTISEGTPTEGVAEPAAASSAQEPDLFAVLVGGKEEKVTLEELTKGYQRQADYTRKTQELSAQRQQLAQMEQLAKALELNPQQTLVALAGALGVNLGGGQPNVQADEGEIDPIEAIKRELSGVKQMLQAQESKGLEAQRLAAERQRTEAEIRKTIDDLKAVNGEFDDNALVAFAVDNQITNLPMAFLRWQQQTREEARIAELNAATAAKRQAQVVTGGSNPQPGATATGSSAKPTFREALRMAMATHS